MNILQGLKRKMEIPTVATIGTFDGVHLGHRKIISETAAAAASSRKSSILITFDRHPKEILSTSKKIQALTSIDTKIRLLAKYNLDYLLLLEFTRELADLMPQDFCEQVLIDKVNIAHLFVGENFRFGAKAAGNAAFLERCGKASKFSVTTVPLLEIDNTIVSSTQIRALVMSGDVDKVPLLLGRFHFVTGEVVKGAGRGIAIGFPTANLDLDSDLCVPREGVYAGYFWLEEEPLAAVINVGSNPTFGPGAIHMEAHIFDFNKAIYGARVRVELQKYLRPEEKFPSAEGLIKQISHDAEQARGWLKHSDPTGWLDRVES